MIEPSPRVLWLLATVVGALTIGSLLRVVSLWTTSPEARRSALSSLTTWWVLVGVFGLAVVLGRLGMTTLFAAISLWALGEFHSLTRQDSDPTSLRISLVLALVHYAAIAVGWDSCSQYTIPVGGLLLLLAAPAVKGRVENYLHTAATTYLSLLLLVFCFSFALQLLVIDETANPQAGGMGWLVYLIVLTQLNDIAQALWGRRLGRHKVTPVVSPNKTWEGLILGGASTVTVSILLAYLLTPMPYKSPHVGGPPLLWTTISGLLIAAGGFLGDISMSSIKRNVGVKDSGTLLPGQGGLLDRIDSLTFTGPLFFLFVRFLYA